MKVFFVRASNISAGEDMVECRLTVLMPVDFFVAMLNNFGSGWVVVDSVEWVVLVDDLSLSVDKRRRS